MASLRALGTVALVLIGLSGVDAGPCKVTPRQSPTELPTPSAVSTDLPSSPALETPILSPTLSVSAPETPIVTPSLSFTSPVEIPDTPINTPTLPANPPVLESPTPTLIVITPPAVDSPTPVSPPPAVVTPPEDETPPAPRFNFVQSPGFDEGLQPWTVDGFFWGNDCRSNPGCLTKTVSHEYSVASVSQQLSGLEVDSPYDISLWFTFDHQGDFVCGLNVYLGDRGFSATLPYESSKGVYSQFEIKNVPAKTTTPTLKMFLICNANGAPPAYLGGTVTLAVDDFAVYLGEGPPLPDPQDSGD